MQHPWDQRSKRQARKWLDPRVALLLSSKSSSKTRGINNTLVKEDIVIPTHCPVLGVKLKAGGRSPDSMSLDRVDSSKGYTKDNIQVISWRANNLKSDGSIKEFELLLNYMKNHITQTKQT